MGCQPDLNSFCRPVVIMRRSWSVARRRVIAIRGRVVVLSKMLAEGAPARICWRSVLFRLFRRQNQCLLPAGCRCRRWHSIQLWRHRLRLEWRLLLELNIAVVVTLVVIVPCSRILLSKRRLVPVMLPDIVRGCKVLRLSSVVALVRGMCRWS